MQILRKNNFLIDISNYLNNEDDFLSNMYSENSTIFKEIIDSLSLEKENIWNDFIKSGVQSKLSEKIKPRIKYLQKGNNEECLCGQVE